MKMLTEEEHAALLRDQERLIATSGEVARLAAEVRALRAGPCCPTCSDPMAANAAIRQMLRDAETANSNCHQRIIETEAERDAAIARAEAAEARVAMLREALGELADAVADDADAAKSISGRVGARLTDARAALADTDTRWLADKLAEASEAARVETKDELNAFHEQRLESARREALEQCRRIVQGHDVFRSEIERMIATAPAKGDDKRAAAEAWVMAGPSDGGVLAWDRPPAPAKGERPAHVGSSGATQDGIADEMAEPAPPDAKCDACGGSGKTIGPLRVSCAVCGGSGWRKATKGRCGAVLRGSRGVADGATCVKPDGHDGDHASGRGAMWGEAPPDAKCATCGGMRIIKGPDFSPSHCPDCGGTGRAGGGE